MTAEQKLIEAFAAARWEAIQPGSPWKTLNQGTRDRFTDEVRDLYEGLRTAGWLLIPPLDTPEGKAAVKRAAETLWADLEDRPDAQDFRIVSRTLRAAGGQQ